MSWSQAAQLHIFAPAESRELQPSYFSSSPSAGTVLNLIFRRQVWQTDVASWSAGEPAPSSSAISLGGARAAHGGGVISSERVKTSGLSSGLASGSANVRVTLDHVEAHDRDDARHHRAPSWRPVIPLYERKHI